MANSTTEFLRKLYDTRSFLTYTTMVSAPTYRTLRNGIEDEELKEIADRNHERLQRYAVDDLKRLARKKRFFQTPDTRASYLLDIAEAYGLEIDPLRHYARKVFSQTPYPLQVIKATKKTLVVALIAGSLGGVGYLANEKYQHHLQQEELREEYFLLRQNAFKEEVREQPVSNFPK